MFRCGTNYELYLVAVNEFGASAQSERVTARTGGLAPRAALEESLILQNSSRLVLNLSSWDAGLCPISSFVVEYQLQGGRGEEWHTVSNNLDDKTELFPIHDLQPHTGYTLRVTAHNSAGSTEHTYSVTTLGTGM